MQAPKSHWEHEKLWGTVVDTPDGEGTIVEPDDDDTNWRKSATVKFDNYDYTDEYYPVYDWNDVDPIEDEEDEEADEFEEDEEEKEDQFVNKDNKGSDKKGSSIIMATVSDRLSKVKASTLINGKAGTLLTFGKQAAKRSLAVLLKARKTAIKVPSPIVKAVEVFLNTELGLGCYAIVAGTVLVFIPRFADDPRWGKIAAAMQTWGFHIVTDGLLDPILDEVQEELGDLLDKAV